MQPLIPVIVFLGFGAFMLAAIIVGSKQAAKRRESLAGLAAELGLSFEHRHDHWHDEEYAHFEVFRRGDDRSAYNTLVGMLEIAGHSVTVKMGDFTYKVTTGSGKDRRTTTYHFSYLIAFLPFQGVPDLLIRPESVLDRIAGVFSNTDIDFESEEFSRRFHIASPDRRFAYDICHPRMMEYLLESRPPAVDIERGRLCLTDGARYWTPDQFRWGVRWVSGFLEQWPIHVINDLKARA